MISEINDITKSVIDENRNLMGSLILKMISAAGTISAGKRSLIERHRVDLIKITFNSLEKVKTRTTVLETTLGILNPENVLRRGYSITTLNGRLIKSAAEVRSEDIIDTQLSDGKIKSKVVKNLK
jgi:exodeoxyribonuclease VII large subunit